MNVHPKRRLVRQGVLAVTALASVGVLASRTQAAQTAVSPPKPSAPLCTISAKDPAQSRKLTDVISVPVTTIPNATREVAQVQDQREAAERAESRRVFVAARDRAAAKLRGEPVDVSKPIPLNLPLAPISRSAVPPMSQEAALAGLIANQEKCVSALPRPSQRRRRS